MFAHNLVRYAISLIVFFAFVAHTSGAVRLGLLDDIENFTYDARIRLSMPGTERPGIVILDIDERSLTAEGQWPWSRDKLAKIVDRLFDDYGVRVLGLDMVFAEPERATNFEILTRLAEGPMKGNAQFQEEVLRLGDELDYDTRFADSLKDRSVALGFVFLDTILDEADARKGALPRALAGPEMLPTLPARYHEPEGFVANLQQLQESAAAGGFFDNPLVDADGVFRRVPLVQKYKDHLYPSLALAVTRLYLGVDELIFDYDAADDRRTDLAIEGVHIGDRFAPTDEQVAVMVPYRGPQFSFPYVSATDVLTGNVTGDVFRDAIVLVGTTAPGLLDLRVTPVGRSFAGVEVHANIVAGILDGTVKHRAPYVKGIETMLLLLLGLLIAWLFPKVSPVVSAISLAAIVGMLVLMALYLWEAANFIIPMGTPVLFVLSVYLLQVSYGYFVERRGKREISRIFGQYVPPELVEEMSASAESLSLEGDTREMTVLFSDVRNFTSISESMDSKQLTELMNAFLSPLTASIHKHRGTIDKYMGDAIMAFWGAPLEDPQHERNALLSGMDMVQVVRGLGDGFEKRGWPRLRIGVGVHAGTMNVGNMGSEFRMAYTVMGDAVNVGSRLEGLTKNYGVDIICSETIKEKVPYFAYRELDLVRVKGKKEPIGIYEPLGHKDEIDPDTKEELIRYRQALRFFRSQAWGQAEMDFFGLQQSGSNHKVYQIYLDRIADYKVNPPPEGWDGVFTHLTK